MRPGRAWGGAYQWHTGRVPGPRNVMPTQYNAHFIVRFPQFEHHAGGDVTRISNRALCSTASLSYRLMADGPLFAYCMMIRTRERNNTGSSGEHTDASRRRARASYFAYQRLDLRQGHGRHRALALQSGVGARLLCSRPKAGLATLHPSPLPQPTLMHSH